ncbi:hypothetical protein [Nodularia sp. UHCC 0506]|nr:hypothetical protein [Nodularia sp. UHCC 0506]MEA5516774.1 hypothetical protein [Nodularia sp. UHCC 0506]
MTLQFQPIAATLVLIFVMRLRRYHHLLETDIIFQFWLRHYHHFTDAV